MMQIAIVGAGYVGLVTSACLAHLGHEVVCLDIDSARVERLISGDLPVHEPGLDELVTEGLDNGRLRFTDDYAAIEGCDLVIVCVGTLDAREEWSDHIVRAAVSDIAADGRLPRAIVIRSTLLPGTARAIAEVAAAIDDSVRLAHNPEFTREATAVSDFLNPDRVIIGVDDHQEDAAAAALVESLRRVYGPLDAPVLVTDLTSAETIKLASNVFLAAKVTFANELSRLAAATGADASAVVDGMGMDQRIVRSFLSPGPGFGGSCFPSQARALPRLACTSTTGRLRGWMKVDSPGATRARDCPNQAFWISASPGSLFSSVVFSRRVRLFVTPIRRNGLSPTFFTRWITGSSAGPSSTSRACSNDSATHPTAPGPGSPSRPRFSRRHRVPSCA